MMNHLRNILVLFFFIAVSLTVPVYAQNMQIPDGETPGMPAPKDPVTRAKAHTELGSLYFQEGDYIVALEELTLAVSINPDYAPAYNLRGLVLYQVKEWDSAEKDFRRALNINEKDPEVNNNFGWFLCQIGREKEALSYFQNAIGNTLYRTPENAYMNMGACLSKLNELDQAEANISKSLRLSPGNPHAYFELANINYKRKNYDAAKKYLEPLVSMNDPGAMVLWLALRVARHSGDSVSETSLASQLKRKYPDSPEHQEFLKGNFE